jgi:hypothetical protein
LTVFEIGGGGQTYTYVSESVVNGLSKTETGLQSGKSYRFTLASVCSDNTTSSFIIVIDVIE